MIESTYRLDYAACRQHLLDRLDEPAPGRIQVLTGPRQVGKTTLLLEVASRFGSAAQYAAGDAPEAALPGFWERIWLDAESQANQARGILLIDEVQHIPDWARRIKGQWDRLRRLKIPLHVVVSGSSALHVGTGSRETLAGRFERLTLTHWPASALASGFKIPSAEAASLVVRLGSYPGAMEFRNDLARWSAYVRDAIIEPAIGRDIVALGSIRKPALLRQLFALCVGMPAQMVSLQKLQGQLLDPGALETIAHYLKLLEDVFLVTGLEKFGERVHRRRAAPPKLVTLSNALLSAMHPEGPPDPKITPARFGNWVENACLTHAWNSGQRIFYWREAPLEVDAVIDGSWGRWALEVKSTRFDSSQLKGLLEFCRRHPRYAPLVVTSPGEEMTARRLGIKGISWIEFLSSGPPAQAG
ncbi:MAG TPA: ATP-binding protein [Acidobacteriota bacterium]|jgi:hypothetical protein|nr:ATP-binding protein [Acidobacteriota bacterium]